MHRTRTLLTVVSLTVCLCGFAETTHGAPDYRFDGTMPREVLGECLYARDLDGGPAQRKRRPGAIACSFP